MIKVKVFPKPVIKGKMDVRFPANVAASKFLTVTRADGTYTFDVDYSLLDTTPLSSPANSLVAALDLSTNTYKATALDSLPYASAAQGALAETAVQPGDVSGMGDMLKATYDPTSVSGDAFSSANTKFLQTGTGAVSRTVQARLRDVINVVDYGADPSGVAASHTAINNAIARAQALGGGTVFLPSGTYKITSPITIATDDINLVGAGIEATRIVPAFASNNVAISIGVSNYARVADLSIRGDTDGTNRVTAGVRITSAYHPLLERLNIEYCQSNIYLANGSPLPYAALLSDIRTNFGGVGLQIGDLGNTNWWQNVLLRNCSFGAATVAGVRIYTVGGLQWNGGECIFNADNMQLLPGTGQTIGGFQINNVFFDTPNSNNINADVTVNGTSGKIIDLTFTSCSINNAQAGYGAAFNGKLTGTRDIDSVKFLGCSFVINATYGLYMQRVQNIDVVHCHFVSNGVAASNTYAGINIGSGTDRIRVRGGYSGARQDFSALQKDGVRIDSTATNVSLDGIDVSTGNLTAGYVNLGSTTGLRIRNCPGIVTHNANQIQIVAGATSRVVTHGLSVTPLRENIFITPLQDFEGRRLWVSAATSTTFTVNMDATLPTDRYFGWSARVEP
jgi:hypothetical protein